MTTTRYARNSRIVDRRMDDDSFLVDPASDALFQLNNTGTAIWRLLAEPLAIDDVVSRLTEAFRDVGAETIRADVQEVFVQLADRGLIVR